ncbi:Glycoside hydrolase, superfamily [Phaffia rhodozyma]|uniref:Glycoside hydrolase, superfamily n=1 Tax=Phaffia rhodozyma TaxID=264483 RepID=A0A0F7SU86_PHARH|nr:Glycoside hydrolase, superfamily [Phaffia rhodozyma]
MDLFGPTEPIKTRGRHFVDSKGRVLWLRGANVGGASKVPSPSSMDLPLDRHREVSYINRPFPLSEADDHLARLASWGFNILRITVTWEAIEHAGRGQYDHDYLQYLTKLLALLPRYSLRAFVVFHQDVWSRLSGGSGAPGWTLEAVGFDLSNDGKILEEVGGAYLGGVRHGGERFEDRGRWPTGYQKLVCATMNTCFWAGDLFASKLKISRPKSDGKGAEEVGIQAYLQEAFLDAYAVLVKAVGHLDSVVGFEMLNEPHHGYIGLPSLHSFNYNTDLHLSDCPSALQSFALGAGHPQTVPHYTRSWPFPTRKTKNVMLNPKGKSVWRKDGPTGGKCLWEWMGVWGWDDSTGQATVLRESFFQKPENLETEKVDFYQDAYLPFIRDWVDTVREALGEKKDDKYLWIECVPNEDVPVWPEDMLTEQLLLAPHWYDLNALFSKTFGFMTINVQGLAKGKFLPSCLYFGRGAARRNYTLQIKNVLQSGYDSFGERPQIMGELGVPMDMNDKLAFQTTDFHYQERMMDALMAALETNLAGFTLWNYNPSNTDEMGDEWNGENFSWFSNKRAIEERKDGLKRKILKEGSVEWYEKGARLLDAIVRPYPITLAGVPISSTYDSKTGSYKLVWGIPPLSYLPADSLSSTTTEIFFPLRTYGTKYSTVDIILDCSEGDVRWDKKNQVLYHKCDERDPLEWRKGEITVFIQGVQLERIWKHRKIAFAILNVVVVTIAVSPKLRGLVWGLLLWLFALLKAYFTSRLEMLAGGI